MRGRLAFCVALTATTVALGAPAHATVPGTNGKIAFTQNTFNDEIYVVDPEVPGSETNITNDPGKDFSPAWSPDGQQIAFISDRGLGNLFQYPDLWIMNANGSDPRKLTPDASGVSDFEWLPDGSRILYHAEHCLTIDVCGWRTVSPAGGDSAPFSGCCGGSRPAWSPYGEPIAYATYYDRGSYAPAIHTINPDGSGEGVLRAGLAVEHSLDWSVDGGRILFDSWGNGPGMKTVEWPSGEVRPVPGSDDFDGWPTWSPDGTRIAFIGQSGPAIVTMRLDGTDRHVITGTGRISDPDWQTLNPQPVPQGYARPKAANVVKAFLVPSYSACTPAVDNRIHGPPLAYPSCNPPRMPSSNLTVGTADSNGVPTVSLGSVQFLTVRGDPSTAADEADVAIEVSVSDVRCRYEVVEDPDTEGFPCRAGALADYSGEVQLVATIRITDKPLTGVRTGTVQDVTQRVTVPCVTTPSDAPGSNCAVSTTVDSLIPGAVSESKRSVWSLGRIELFDGGIEGDAETTYNNELFETQGIFVP